MIERNHTNKVHLKPGKKLNPDLADNIYSVYNQPSLPLLSQLRNSRLVRSVCLFSLDALALLAISVSLYYLAVGSCLLDDACYTMYYGVSQ
jgi:hypothetical protein